MSEVKRNIDETSEVVEIEIEAPPTPPSLTETVAIATDAPTAPEPDSEGVFMIAPFLVCVCREEHFEKAQGLGYQIIYTPYEDGYLKHTTLKHGCFIRIKEKALPSIPAGWVKPVMQGLKPDVKFLPDGKVPKTILQQVITFFKAVMKTLNNDDEAMLHVMWNKEQGYHIVVPKQTVSKASVNYDRTHMDGESMVVLDIHSH